MRSSRTARRIGGFLGTLFAGAVLAVAPATGAHANPVITDVSCESGAATLVCYLAYTGTQDPTIHWSVDGVPRPGWDGATHVRSGCQVGQFYTISVSVVDVYGVATERLAVQCRRIWQ
ncbi:hypothetical protein [Polymorphospora sp. NPDC050346]|uniref:hypothetical protein n=1 Tax=Polymorphospora sp. NPDC050346 TaxID=3155780 RepID=UPI0033EA67D9